MHLFHPPPPGHRSQPATELPLLFPFPWPFPPPFRHKSPRPLPGVGTGFLALAVCGSPGFLPGPQFLASEFWA